MELADSQNYWRRFYSLPAILIENILGFLSFRESNSRCWRFMVAGWQSLYLLYHMIWNLILELNWNRMSYLCFSWILAVVGLFITTLMVQWSLSIEIEGYQNPSFLRYSSFTKASSSLPFPCLCWLQIVACVCWCVFLIMNTFIIINAGKQFMLCTSFRFY